MLCAIVLWFCRSKQPLYALCKQLNTRPVVPNLFVNNLREFIKMTIFHDEIEIEDFEYNEEEDMYYYPCPCGDRFQISKEELMAGEEVATCPSCSLVVKVIYDLEKFKAEAEEVKSDLSEKEALKV